MSQSPSLILSGHTSDVNCVDFSTSGLLISCSNDKTLRLWKNHSRDNDDTVDVDVPFNFTENTSSQPTSPFVGHKYGVNCVKFSPFDTIIASGSTDGAIILWNAQTGEQVVKLTQPSGGAIRVCCFSPSCAILASGGDDETVCLWDISTRSLIRSLSGHEATVTACAFTPDSNFLVSASSAGDLKIWDARHGHGKCLLTFPEAHDLGVLGVDFSSKYQVDCKLYQLFLFFPPLFLCIHCTIYLSPRYSRTLLLLVVYFTLFPLHHQRQPFQCNHITYWHLVVTMTK